MASFFFFFFQAEDGIRDLYVTGVQTCALPISFLEAIKEALQNQKNIEVRGFGTFKIRHRKTRMARNPRTGSPVEVSARPVPRSEEHTSELQSRRDLVCRLLLEKKKKIIHHTTI